jgi:hypothetical protein
MGDDVAHSDWRLFLVVTRASSFAT